MYAVLVASVVMTPDRANPVVDALNGSVNSWGRGSPAMPLDSSMQQQPFWQ
jgi:hypothetical protein